MAAPYVAGLLARYLDAHPGSSPAQVRAAVQYATTDIESPGFDNNTGHGLIDGYRLIVGVPGLPGTPVGVTAGPGNRSATVSWSAAPSNGSPITRYTVTASPGGATVATTAGSATVPGLSNGTRYTFTVSATNGIGTGPASVASNPVTPMSADAIERYVTRVYADLFHRGPDTVGLNDWSSALGRGTPYGAVANGITYSPEFRSRLITGSYQRYLGRVPDAGGLQGWLTEMDRGMHIEQMQSGFISSVEFYQRAGADDRQWIADLYQTVLKRPAVVSEIDFWQSQLIAGASHRGVALGFLYSTEYLNAVVNGYYLDLLRRPIDPGGSHTWVTAIQQGSRDEEIIAFIVSSPEYRGNV
jgi:hypothetical protein